MSPLLALVVLAAAPPGAVHLIQAPQAESRLSLELPLFDAPFNVTRGFNWPSPPQAVAVTTDVYDLAHWAIGRALDPWSETAWKKALGITAITAFDTLTFLVAGPTSSAWTHEEFHVGVLTTQGVRSRNPLSYGFSLPLFAPATVEVNTEEIELFKQANPAAFSYVNVAGFQAHAALAQRFERNLFFDDQPVLSNFIIGLNHALPPLYDLICLGSAQGDCAWQVRHLFAPGESTADRPFTAPEEAYLGRQLGLSLLNFVDPFLFSIRGVGVPLSDGRELVLNAALRHVPTPFGQEVRLDAFFKLDRLAARVSLHNGFNQAAWCPGLSVEAQWTVWHLRLSGSVSGWLQPAAQSFTSPLLAPGGHATVRVGAVLLDGRLVPWLEGEAKSAGWLLSNPWLDARASVRVGLTLGL